MNLPTPTATYQLRQLEFLSRIARAMTSRLDLSSLLRLILGSAAKMLNCPAGLIALKRVDNEQHIQDGGIQVEQTQFQIFAYYGIPLDLLFAFNPLLDIAPLVPISVANQQDGAENSDFEITSQLDFQDRLRRVEESLGATLGKVVGLPLLFENELLGIIYMFRGEHAFTQLDGQFLRGFADQAAIAVRNARLYQQLERERTRLDTVIQNSANGIMILDPRRYVVVINQALATMLDVVPDDVVGRACHTVLQLENVEGDNLCISQGFVDFLNPEGLRCEGEIIQPGGRHIAVSVTYTPLYDDGNRLVNIIANVHDITRFREEEEMKSTFTSIISHELKTPVALIKGYAQTLARPDVEWDAETARQSLEIIEEEADRLEALINNLLDVSRIQASGLRLDLSYVDLSQMITKIAEAYRIQSDQHDIQVDLAINLPLITGDEERLRQVLTNLVSNAIKYSPDGGVIRIGGWEENQSDATSVYSIVLYVADQGIGIPQSELSQIFDQFYRVDSSFRRRTAGAGLGLFLSKAIVEAHNGEIWVRSEPFKGTTFFIRLPIEFAEIH
ncbi:PAS domain-containing protein [Chloroflexi bacterium TSY]|nr:PAS domain-containing protein [Chloroflexi bacterium TSY]